MSSPADAEDIANVRRRNPTWVIVTGDNGTYTARRDWWGNQQIVTVPTLAELDASLQGLDKGPANGQSRSAPTPGTAEGTQAT